MTMLLGDAMPLRPPLLQVENLVKRFAGVAATNNVSLTSRDTELHAVIGPNGAGKSTLVAQIAGELYPDAGRILFDGTDITGLSAEARARLGIARSYQVARVFSEMTALQNVMVAVFGRIGKMLAVWRSLDRNTEIKELAYASLTRVGLADRADVAASILSHGERRTLELAMVLAVPPRLLILDEPMAGLGSAESARLTELLSEMKGNFGIILIEHDMDAVFALADLITVLVYGRVLITDTPARVKADRGVQDAYLGDEGVANESVIDIIDTSSAARQNKRPKDPRHDAGPSAG
jgi:branched-chain amino acid transport system ATP-binding protein